MDENTLKETIEKARRLKQEMTPGGWDWSACGLEAYTPDMGDADGEIVLDTEGQGANTCRTFADAEAIAAAPLLVDAVITLADSLALAEREIARLRNLFKVSG